MPIFLLFFAALCVFVVIFNEAMDLPVRRRITDAGRSRIDAPAQGPRPV
jgi:hypothetical protein